MQWWDWAVLVITALSLIGLCFQIWEHWWHQPPRGIRIQKKTVTNPKDGTEKIWVTFVPTGSGIAYEPKFTFIECSFMKNDHSGKVWESDDHVVTAQNPIAIYVIPLAGRQPSSAMVEIEWASALNRGSHLRRCRLILETGQLQDFRRLRFARLHGEPGRWVETKESHEVSG